MLINPLNVIALLVLTFNTQRLDIGETDINADEAHLHDVIEDVIKRSAVDSFFDIDQILTLDFLDGDSVVQPQAVGDSEEDHSELDYADVPHCMSTPEEVNFNYKVEAVAFWTSGKSSHMSLSSVQNRFRKVSSERQLRRWRIQVNEGGTKTDKLYRVAQYTLDNLKEAIDSKITVHDIDVRRWALQKKHELNMTWFKAGRWWVWQFKKTHNIVSRKITKFVSVSSIHEGTDLEEQCESFLNSVKPRILRYGVSNVYNSDQSGFNLEMHSGRTLTYRGSKTVESVVQSVSSTTHSYTIQPTISADGKLLSPLFLVLKEQTGEFGPRVSEGLFRPSNVFIEASKSGKLTSELLQTWLEEVFFPNVGNSSLLLLDSWSGQCNRTVLQVVPQNKHFDLMTIPKGTTGKIQPLDVFGFRIWKNFVRKFSDTVILLRSDINLHNRNNIIKLQSLTHNQLSSPRFINLFKYTWYKSGYLEERPTVFENPVDFCFKDMEPICDICGEIAVITCAWCKKKLCLKHFFEEYHYCEHFIP